MLSLLFNYLIFPGFLFSASLGLLAGWLDRKVTARIQYRVGPPWHQNFTDIIKLFGKETIVPEAAKLTFSLAPYLGLLSAGLAAAILGRSILWPFEGFSGDLIVILYLLTIPAIALILGASSSRNPLASIGASREIKLLLGYELPFILSLLTIIIKSQGAIRLDEIIAYQAARGSFIFSLSGILAFVVTILCAQAKLGLVPFDIAEAEQEIMAGALIEYSGRLLAIFKLTKAILLYTLPLFLTVIFLARDLSPRFIILKFIAILVIFILIKNTNPRLRIEQALKFFWGPLTALAVIAVIAALFGL